jgi:4-diphosphocytidyl-2-C-methyl-D-erythritol kinase
MDAPCKINLHLRVKERRSDGFHEVESIVVALAFGDTLHFELGDAGGVDEFLTEYGASQTSGRETGDVSGKISDVDNTVLKAAALFRAQTGFDRPLRIRLEKRVPLGAGLGGGSSDCAASLVALNELARQAGHPRLLDKGALGQAAAELGSDMPFFLEVLSSGGEGAAWASGRGERVRLIEGPRNCAVLLANPGFPSNTAEAYRLLDAHRDRRGSPLRTETSAGSLIEALRGPPSRWPYENDFLEVFLAKNGAPAFAYRTILESLRSQGADFCGLTGSGSTCFGIFAGESAAEQAAEAALSTRFASEHRVFTALTFPLAHFGKRVLL